MYRYSHFSPTYNFFADIIRLKDYTHFGETSRINADYFHSKGQMFSKDKLIINLSIQRKSFKYFTSLKKIYLIWKNVVS